MRDRSVPDSAPPLARRRPAAGARRAATLLERRKQPGRRALVAAALLACAADPAASAEETARATLRGVDGSVLGEASLRETPHGVLLWLSLTGAPEGTHALHFHETGRCEPPFRTAGGHFAPEGRGHGFFNAGGPHAGDLPNVTVPASGRLQIEVLAPRTDLSAGANGLLDEDGAALLLHADPDDYRSAPSGAAGARIACGVIRGDSWR